MCTTDYAYAPLVGTGYGYDESGLERLDSVGTSTASSYYAVTGQELIQKLEEDREQVRITMAAMGGSVGFIIFGPAVGIFLAGTYALISNEDLKQRESIVRHEMAGRLNEPIAANGMATDFLTRITEESPQASGNSLRRQREKNRNRITVAMGVAGGIVGLILIGPLAAVAIGAGNALITKHGLMRRRSGKRTRNCRTRSAQDEKRLAVPLLNNE